MSTTTIEQFFTGKSLVIPSYQRDYAWKIKNVNELFNDIDEAIEGPGGHYLGTFILSQKNGDRTEPVHVVDGQQRLTTLTMLLHASIDAVEDEGIRQYYRNTFIHHPVTGLKFRVLGQNEVFFREVLNNKTPEPLTDGQERLLKVYEWIRQRVLTMLNKDGQVRIQQWLRGISELQVLEFIETDEGKAIRMFQSVNDRGVQLGKMDILKSLLVYYSNRYLQGRLDNHVAEGFGAAFRSFNRIKRLARELGYQVKHINRESFTEDDVLRYHYFAFDDAAFGGSAGADYNATAQRVLDYFLKPELDRLRSTPDALEAFISAYTDDLVAFFGGLEALLDATRTDKDSYLLLVSQDIAATLYPLLIRLYLKGWLTERENGNKKRTLMELLELVDFRVFKLRGTNPQADIAWITRILPNCTVQDVAQHLLNFCRKWMPDALMASRLLADDMYRHPGLQRILLESEEQARSALQRPALDINDMVALTKEGLSIEHILPQEPSFNVTAYGFVNNDEYLQYLHRLGNLLLLEKSINSACSNSTVEQKITAPNLYHASSLRSVGALAANHVVQGSYKKADLNIRSQALADMVAARWSINDEVAALVDSDVVNEAEV